MENVSPKSDVAVIVPAKASDLQTKPDRDSSRRKFVAVGAISALVGLAVGTIAATLLASSGSAEMRQIGLGLLNVAFIVLGMVTMASLSALQRGTSHEESLETESEKIAVPFNLKMLVEEDETDERQTEKAIEPYEATAERLVGIDNALALARLRLDIEPELRRLAHENGLDMNAHRMNATNLVDELVRHKALPVEQVEDLLEVIEVCNQAVHGGYIEDAEAHAVVHAGNRLLARIRLAGLQTSVPVAMQMQEISPRPISLETKEY